MRNGSSQNKNFSLSLAHVKTSLNKNSPLCQIHSIKHLQKHPSSPSKSFASDLDKRHRERERERERERYDSWDSACIKVYKKDKMRFRPNNDLLIEHNFYIKTTTYYGAVFRYYLHIK